ncbi:MAG TPA: tripartite tricarboxylate transporter substrate binding protein [Xanthobacteraceae bacterium]|nr:tripartite tricarboxylate transporter substrate binding protein [Xanthobacteraceae bacterium]
MKLSRRRFLQFAGAVAAGPVLPQHARALDYPVKPIRWIIGYPAGGSADTVSRILAQWLTERLGQPIIIENKPGAATNISLQAAISAPPDGYTMVYLGTSATVNPSFFESLPFNVLRDIAPVSGIYDSPLVLVVNNSIRSKTTAEFIAYAKANPGKINMASFGVGTTSHLAGELFQAMTGTKLVHVPYRGEAFALSDMISGQVQVMFDTLSAALPHIRSGALRALGVTSKTRYEGLPDVPTVDETVAGYEAISWGGIGVPRGTPAAVIARLNREVNAALADPAVRKRFDDLAGRPIFYAPADFGAFMAAETEKWANVVKLSGVKAE